MHVGQTTDMNWRDGPSTIVSFRDHLIGFSSWEKEEKAKMKIQFYEGNVSICYLFSWILDIIVKVSKNKVLQGHKLWHFQDIPK